MIMYLVGSGILAVGFLFGCAWGSREVDNLKVELLDEKTDYYQLDGKLDMARVQISKEKLIAVAFQTKANKLYKENLKLKDKLLTKENKVAKKKVVKKKVAKKKVVKKKVAKKVAKKKVAKKSMAKKAVVDRDKAQAKAHVSVRKKATAIKKAIANPKMKKKARGKSGY